jgi:hypothetical protein
MGASNNIKEHTLLVTYAHGDYKCTVAGVHLTSKNTSANSSALKLQLDNLQKFCEENEVDLAIGDFNMNMNQYSGSTGARFGSSVFVAQSAASPVNVSYHEQFTNSSNDKHFMGYYIANPQKTFLEGVGLVSLHGLSLSRSVGGRYFSDHAPIYVNVRCKAKS